MLYSSEAYVRGMWPRVNAYYSKTYLGYDMPLHRHVNAEVMYVFSGECVVDVEPDGEAAFAHPMRAGDFIFLNARVRHRLSVDGDAQCTMLNVEFTLAPAEGMFTLAQLRAGSPDYAWFVALGRDWCVGSDLRGELFKAMDAVVSGLETDRDATALRHAEMAILLMQLSRAVREGLQKPGATLYVRRAAGFIRQSHTRPLSLKQVAAKVGISQGHLAWLFRAETGQTIAGYIARVRIDHAAVLLERSRLSVTDIAAQVGFNTRQQFGVAFKRRYGLTPGEYRIKRRSNSYPQVQRRVLEYPPGD